MNEKETKIVEETIETKEEKEIQSEEVQEAQEEQESIAKVEQEKMPQNEPNVTILEEEKETIEQEKAEIKKRKDLPENEQETKTVDGLHRYTKVILIISILLVIAAMVFSTVFALMNKSNDCIVDGVSIKGIDISGLTREEATNALNEVLEEQGKKNIILKHADFETAITPEQIEMDFKLSEAIDLAHGIGRTGKVLKDNYDIINAKLAKIDINPGYSYNDELLTDFIISTQEGLPDIVKQSGYSVNDSNLIIDKGQTGVAIEQENLKKQIVETSQDFRSRRSYD